MNIKTRREFIRTASLLSAGAMAMKAFPFNIPNPLEEMIGLQLYTLRDTVEKDTLDTLIKVSEIGYNSLEPYGFDGKFFGYPAKEFRQVAEDLGMKVTSTHASITRDNASILAYEGAEAGLEYLVLPSFSGRPDKTPDDFKRAAEEMNRIGEITKKAGIRFGYHNHDFEFKDSDEGILYDILLKEIEPDLVCFELDIFWIIKGGQDPLVYFKNFPGRFELWHVKDMDEKGNSCVIGQGNIDYQKIFTHADESGMKRFYVEQEQYEDSPITETEKSYNFISNYLVSE